MTNDEYFDKWRTIVDGDTWFWCKSVTGGRFGALGHESIGIVIYLNIHAPARENSNYSGNSSVKFTLDKDRASKLLKYVQECSAFSSSGKLEDWGKKGTYLIREIKTKHDAIINISTSNNNKVSIKFIVYDSRGEDYLYSAVSTEVNLNNDGVKEFGDILQKAIENS